MVKVALDLLLINHEFQGSFFIYLFFKNQNMTFYGAFKLAIQIQVLVGHDRLCGSLTNKTRRISGSFMNFEL